MGICDYRYLITNFVIYLKKTDMKYQFPLATMGALKVFSGGISISKFGEEIEQFK